jgi:hypothetical protein
METSEVQALEKANAIMRAWTRRHNQAAVLMAAPLVAGFVMMSFFPSAFSDVVLAFTPVISLTTGVFLIPDDFRSRRGSMTSAFCLVAAMWGVAVLVALCLSGGWLVWDQLGRSDTHTKFDLATEAPASASKDSAPLNVEDNDLAIRIPFTLTPENNISIRALLNENEHLQLMFHTAEDSIVLTRKTTEKLKGFKVNGSVDVETWGGKAASGVSTGNRLRIGTLAWDNQVIFIDEYSGKGTDGKFGPNLFAGKVIEINFESCELIIHPALPEFVLAPTSTYKRMEISLEHGSMYLVGSLDIGDRKIQNKFMLHTGFGGTALLDDEFVRVHQLADQLETISQRELKDAFGNTLKTRKVRLRSLDFDGIQFADIPIEVFDGALGRQKVSVIGGGLIKQLNMVIDPAKNCLYLSPNRLFGMQGD